MCTVARYPSTKAVCYHLLEEGKTTSECAAFPPAIIRLGSGARYKAADARLSDACLIRGAGRGIGGFLRWRVGPCPARAGQLWEDAGCHGGLGDTSDFMCW